MSDPLSDLIRTVVREEIHRAIGGLRQQIEGMSRPAESKPSGLLVVTEVAKLARIRKKTVYEAIACGDLAVADERRGRGGKLVQYIEAQVAEAWARSRKRNRVGCQPSTY